MRELLRHGDVILVPVDSIPAGGKELPRENGAIVLAYGEVTGHSHTIMTPSVRWIEVDGERYVESAAPFVIEHQEHAALHGVGAYLVGVQVEHHREQLRIVRD